MEILAIPFVEHLNMQQENEKLFLEPQKALENHIGTVHASAQFTLAETQSGLFLSLLFPQEQENVLPLLRSSSVKYKKPATGRLYAQASVTQEELEKFQKQFIKGRATISVNVNILNEAQEITMTGEFVWFVTTVK